MNTKLYYEYCSRVLNGEIIAGETIKLACKRFQNDLKRDDLEFKEDKVDRAILFISTLKHYTGKHSGKPFTLEGWQQFIIANIVGFYWKGTTTRRYTSSYIEVSRKQGKTALAAALCLYYLIADGEDGAEVLLAANSKEQAKIAFDMCSKFSKGLDSKGKYLPAYRADILFNLTNSKLKVLAADDSKLDGFNASFGLLDEYHAAKNSKVRDVIKSSMGMRMNPHLCTITTAGFDKTLPCYQLRTVAIEVLNGLKVDDEMFIAIYSLDADDDWRDEENWVKCAPNLDITVTSKYIRGQVQQAINNPADEVGVKTKTLNLWCDSSNVWLPEDYIIKCSQEVDLNKFAGMDCYVGVDLAATSDLTAVAYLVVLDGTYYFKTHYYLPESALKDKADKELYKYWKQQGYLTVTSGNVTDYDYITTDMLRYADVVNIQSVGYDKYNATQWAIDSTEQGLPLEEYPQTLGNFNMPTRELERLILSGKAVIDNNEINRYCFRNVTLKAIPDVHLEDVWFKPVLNQDNESGRVSVSMKVSATDSQNVTAGFILKDREENILVEKSLQLNKENNHLEGTICVDLESVKLWDNHNPYLYHAYVELKAEDGSLAEVIPYDIGFRRIEIIDKVVYLNGKRLVITGVNRHEWNARTGRCIGIEDMKADISCILRNNINSVRTCHYPDQIPWYYMCDDAGIYVMAETNLESHGSFQKLGAIEPSCNVPGSIPQWRDAVLERAKNNFETFKNHTSILFWSLGNESYAGDDIEAMNVYFAEKKDGRLVHYESAYYNRAYEDTISDFETRMYAKPEDVEEYLNNSPKKPYILCEFMHDMGNSMGGLGSYMKLIDKYDMYHGGFIWDFIDQAIMVKDPVTGKDVLRYGGDFDDKPADYEFSANGIVFADRKEKPAMQEVRYYYGLYR